MFSHFICIQEMSLFIKSNFHFHIILLLTILILPVLNNHLLQNSAWRKVSCDLVKTCMIRLQVTAS